MHNWKPGDMFVSNKFSPLGVVGVVTKVADDYINGWYCMYRQDGTLHSYNPEGVWKKLDDTLIVVVTRKGSINAAA